MRKHRHELVVAAAPHTQLLGARQLIPNLKVIYVLPDTVLDVEPMFDKLVIDAAAVDALAAHVLTASRFRWIIHGRLRFSPSDDSMISTTPHPTNPPLGLPGCFVRVASRAIANAREARQGRRTRLCGSEHPQRGGYDSELGPIWVA